jgi:hydrogenase nickel incorporation protein HypA/HybF
MHELSIAQEIIAVVLERAGAAQVKRVTLEIGRLSAVLPDAVRTCFEICIEETPLKDTALEIIETPGVARCTACSTQLILDRPFGRCGCGCSELEWLSGEELRIRQMEVI